GEPVQRVQLRVVNILVIVDPFEHKKSEEPRKMPYMHCD
nr:hypothetical protein [Tanacetum cinerariifolium]